MSKLMVVTGGTHGIGKAIIEKFAAHHFDVATCSRNEAELAAVKKNVESKFSTRVEICPTDMASKAEVKEFSKFVVGLNRPIDVLVNNAGFFSPGEIINEPEGNLESMIESNVYSAYYATRGIIPAIRKDGQGHIFNICSIASIMAYPNGGSYAISKFALLGFSKVLRAELTEQQIRVTAVLPGATWTRSWETAGLPEDRFMRAEDVADAVFGAYSLSPRSVVEEILIRPQLGDI